ncbi:hypothetical protein ACFL59_04760 [Planctomycetota bacterium]
MLIADRSSYEAPGGMSMDLKTRLGVLEKRSALQLLVAVARAGGRICEAAEAVIQEAAAELDYPHAEVDLERAAEWGSLASHVAKRSLRKRLIAYFGRLIEIYRPSDAEVWVHVLADSWGLEPPAPAGCSEEAMPYPLLERARKREERKVALLQSLSSEQQLLLGVPSTEERLLPAEVDRLLSAGLGVIEPEPAPAPRQVSLAWWELGRYGGEDGSCVFGSRSFRHCLTWLPLPLVGMAVLVELGPVAVQVLAAPLALASAFALARPFYLHRRRSRAFLRSAPVEAALITRIREEERHGEWDSWTQCFCTYAYRWGSVEAQGRFDENKDDTDPVLLGDRIWVLVNPWEPKHSLKWDWVEQWSYTLQSARGQRGLWDPGIRPRQVSLIPVDPSGNAQVRSADTVTVKVQPEQRCPYCRDRLLPVQPEDLLICGGCEGVFHRACVREARSCTTPGCRNRTEPS